LHHLEEKLVSEWLYYGLVYWRENSHCWTYNQKAFIL
jgi:hypothetical protein